MTRIILAAISAGAVLLAIASAANATVIFGFYETAITTCQAASCTQPLQPTLVMTLQLSDLTETGSAKYGFLPPVYNGPRPPVVTDANFRFAASIPSAGPAVFAQIAPPTFGNGDTLAYDISWSEVNGDLTAVSVNFSNSLDTIGYGIGAFGLTGGGVGSDGNIWGCGPGTCMVAGYWQRIPEPASALLLLTTLFGFGLVRRRRR